MKNKKYCVDFVNGYLVLSFRKFLFLKKIKFITYNNLFNYSISHDLPIYHFEYTESAILEILPNID